MQDADSALGAQELRDGEPRTDTEGSRGAKPARRRDRAGSRREKKKKVKKRNNNNTRMDLKFKIKWKREKQMLERKKVIDGK